LVQHVAGKRRSGQLWADGWCLLDIGAGIGKGLKVLLIHCLTEETDPAYREPAPCGHFYE